MSVITPIAVTPASTDSGSSLAPPAGVGSKNSTSASQATASNSTTAGGIAESSAKSVIGVLDSDHKWKLYQVSINTDTGPGSGTRTASDMGSGSGSSVTLTPLPDQPLTLANQMDRGPRSRPALDGDDVASAQTLASTPYQSVVGILDADHNWRVYRIPIDSKTTLLALELLSQSGNLPAGEQMSLYDGSGRKLADSSPDPDQQRLSLNYALDPASQATEVYLKVVAPPESFDPTQGSGATSSVFDLNVTQQPGAIPPGPVVDPSSTPTSRVENPSSSTSQPTVLLPPVTTTTTTVPRSMPLPAMSASIYLSQNGSGSAPMVAPPPSAVRAESETVGLGPLPEREGAALGGVLSEGDPAPPLDRHDAAMVDPSLAGAPRQDVLELDGINLEDLTAAELSAILAEFDLAAEIAGALVTVRGPGGFPLLVPSLQGQPAPDLDALAAVLPDATSPVKAEAVAVDPTTIPIETAAVATETPPRRFSRVSALSGLAVAMALVFGLVRPDLTTLLNIDEGRRFRLRSSLLRRLRCRAGV